MEKLEHSHIKSIFKSRKADAHKGTNGHVLLLAGQKGKMGAAIIAAKACLRSGVGLLTVSISDEERVILQISVPEAMIQDRKGIEFEAYSAIAVGPGLGTESTSIELVRKVVENTKKPLVLDADALNCISIHHDILKSLPAKTILTPHPTEFDRLFGIHTSKEARVETAIQKAKELNVIIVLKGHQTMITSGEMSFTNVTGNEGLAKGGSGDALTGIIAAFLAQGYDSFSAAQLGVYIHGLAADFTLDTQSVESMIITDVIDNLGRAFKEIR